MKQDLDHTNPKSQNTLSSRKCIDSCFTPITSSRTILPLLFLPLVTARILTPSLSFRPSPTLNTLNDYLVIDKSKSHLDHSQVELHTRNVSRTLTFRRPRRFLLLDRSLLRTSLSRDRKRWISLRVYAGYLVRLESSSHFVS